MGRERAKKRWGGDSGWVGSGGDRDEAEGGEGAGGVERWEG